MLLNGLNSRLDLAKKKISELEDVLFQMFKTKKQKQKEKKMVENIQEYGDSYKRCSIYIMGISKGKKDMNIRNN